MVCIIKRSHSASLLLQGLATKHANVKWTTTERGLKNSGSLPKFQLTCKDHCFILVKFLNKKWKKPSTTFSTNEFLSFKDLLVQKSNHA